MSAQPQKAAPTPKNAPNIFVGRQPIYNATLNIFGYELLFRSNSTENRANAIDGDMATARVVIQTFLDLGLENLVGHHKAFINVTKNFLSGAISIPFGKKQAILEVLENIPVTNETIEGLKELKQQGYTIALDDFVLNDKNHPFLAFADIVKIDVLATKTKIDTKLVRDLKFKGIRLLAEKVETKKQFDEYKKLGFEFFQGYFLSKPEIVTGRKISDNKNLLLHLLARLQDPEIEFSELNELIKRDPSLSLRLLKYINSPAVGLRSTVDSIQQAIVMIGLNELKRWVSLIVIATISESCPETVHIALTRARMCELLSKNAHLGDANVNFTVGLFSALDTMLDVPLDQVLKSLPLAQNVNQALLKHEGVEGKILDCVMSYEIGDWGHVNLAQVSSDVIKTAYLDSIKWTEQAVSSMV